MGKEKKPVGEVLAAIINSKDWSSRWSTKLSVVDIVSVGSLELLEESLNYVLLSNLFKDGSLGSRYEHRSLGVEFTGRFARNLRDEDSCLWVERGGGWHAEADELVGERQGWVEDEL